MKFMKLLLFTIVAASSYSLFARPFDITIDPNASFITQQGAPAPQGGRIDIAGGLFHGDNPSYSDISREIIRKFDLDIKAKNLEITFMDPSTGRTGLLKPEISGMRAKNRLMFFDSIQNQNGVIMLNVTKPGMAQEGMVMAGAEMQEPGYQAGYQAGYKKPYQAGYQAGY